MHNAYERNRTEKFYTARVQKVKKSTLDFITKNCVFTRSGGARYVKEKRTSVHQGFRESWAYVLGAKI